MSYTSDQKDFAIMFIGQFGSAAISDNMYEDLEKFRLINITRKENKILGASLTFSGNEVFKKLKRTAEYAAMISNQGNILNSY